MKAHLAASPPGSAGLTAPCAQHPAAPVIGGLCGGCTQYPVDMRPSPAGARVFLAPVDADPADPSAWKEIGYVTDSSFTETPEWDTADPYPFAHLKISPFTASVSMSRCRVFHPWIYPPCVDAVAAIEKRAVRWRAAAILAEALHRPLWPCPLPFAGRNVSERLCCR